MENQEDTKLEGIIGENRQAMVKLRSLTENLAFVVEHEKQVMEDVPLTSMSSESTEETPL